MDEMRADMGGAACVVATIKAAASLKLPINIRGKFYLSITLHKFKNKNMFFRTCSAVRKHAKWQGY
jgi:hypothetical protein